MRWRKLGLIFCAGNQSSEMQSEGRTPVPLLIDEDVQHHLNQFYLKKNGNFEHKGFLEIFIEYRLDDTCDISLNIINEIKLRIELINLEVDDY